MANFNPMPLNTEKFRQVIENMRDGKPSNLLDEFVPMDLSGLMTTSQSTRGLSWNIPKLDEYTRDVDYLINSATWQSQEVLGRGFDLNIEDEDKDPMAVKRIQDYIRERLYLPLYNIFYLGYFHGGSAGLIVIKGQLSKTALKKPLRISECKKGDFLGIKPLTRLYNIQPYYEGGFIAEIGDKSGIYDANELGKPMYYRVSFNSDLYNTNQSEDGSSPQGASSFIVHRSRLLIYNSSPLSSVEERIEQFFGVSIGESALIPIRRFENAMYQINKLLARSNTPTYNADKLANATLQGDRHKKQVAEIIDSIQLGIDYGDVIVIGDKNKEALTYASVSFTDIPAIITEQKKLLANGCKAPASKVLGEYNADDDHSMDYIIDALSERHLRSFLYQLIPLLYHNLYEKEIKSYSFTFKSLEKPTEKEKAEKMKTAMEIISIMWKDGVLNQSSYHRMVLSLSDNVSDMLNELQAIYVEYTKNEEAKGEFVTYHTLQERLAKALNQGAGNSVEASMKGAQQGGDNKNTKSPTPRVPVKDSMIKEVADSFNLPNGKGGGKIDEE